MKILISGSTGYIAQHLINTLIELEHIVYVVVREDTNLSRINSRISKKNIIKYEPIDELYLALEQVKPDIFIHMATFYKFECIGSEISTLIDANIKYGTIMLDACSKSGCKKFINIGSILQHYEGALYNPTCLYAATKEAFQNILEYYVQSEGCSAVTLELMDTYGPGDTRSKIINLFRGIATTGETLEMSGGEQEIGLVYIKDVIKAINKAIDKLNILTCGQKKIYAVAPRKFEILKDVASLFEEISGKHLNIEWGKRSYREKEIMNIISPYSNILENEETFSLEEGLKELLELEK